MTADFTGERVVPGQVDADLWNEHMARYAFAARLVHGCRVLDAGCGTGYGSAELAASAASVTGMDIAPEAAGWAQTHYRASNLKWAQGSCAALPFRSESFDVVIAFEVIEHLTDWANLLVEARRVLASGGRFIVSTPNKSFYAKTRELEGPNPFHHHEFEYGEFCEALARFFPHVSMFLEDHSEGVLFRSLRGGVEADARLGSSESMPEDASFYVAVCSLNQQPDLSSFVYVPRASNLLGEKLLHIERLENELETKNKWLTEAQETHAQLVEAHRLLQAQLEERNRWAESLNEKLTAAGERIVQLQDELVEQNAGYQSQLSELNVELDQRTQWAKQIEADLQHQTSELARCVEVLHQTEATLEERTHWAQQLNEQKMGLEGVLQAAQLSRWLRLGRAIGLGPELNKR